MVKNSSSRSATGSTSHGSGRAPGVLLGAAMVVFVAGSIFCGLFFLSKVGDILGWDGVSPQGSMGEKQAGAETGSVAGGTQGSPGGVPARQASDPRYAFLLLGYGGAGHDGAYLTDSMMVVIVDPVGKSLTLLSIPRDAWVPMLFNGKSAVYNKVNTAYAFAKDASLYTDRLPRYKGSQGAGTLAMDTVARLLGIPISYYMALDFAGFREMINLVGGIDIDVPEGFAANYPANDDPSIDPSWKVVRFSKGMQHMDGERAIEYARAREVIDNVSEGSDFARSRRQRLIMEAFKARLLQPSGLIHLPQLLALGSSHVDTNYPLPSVAQLGEFALEWKSVHFYQTALTGENYLEDATGPSGTYILVPNSQGQSWAPIQAFCQRLWKNPELGAAMANTEIVVQNDTGVAGVAGQVSESLARMGYRVGSPVTGPVRPQSRVLDRTGGDSQALVRQLEADLRVRLGEAQVEKGTDPASVVLEIGSDDAGLANLAVSLDSSAPSSSAGVVRSGSWSPEVAAPIPAATARPSASETGSRYPTPGHPTSTARVPTSSTVTPTATPRPSRPTLGPAGSPTQVPAGIRPAPTPTPRAVAPGRSYPASPRQPQPTPAV